MDLSKVKFAKTHEWVSIDGTVGISEHAQKEITDIVFVELPQVQKKLDQNGEAGTLESVKAAFPIYAPVSGCVTAVNEKVLKKPELINQSPYQEGWLFKLEISNPLELDSLMTYDQYQNFIKEDLHLTGLTN